MSVYYEQVEIRFAFNCAAVFLRFVNSFQKEPYRLYPHSITTSFCSVRLHRQEPYDPFFFSPRLYFFTAFNYILPFRSFVSLRDVQFIFPV